MHASVNESFFDTIDTPQKAYFLGWMYSDGTNNPARGLISLRLKSTDRGVIERLRTYIGYEGNVTTYQRTGRFPDGTTHTGQYTGWTIYSRRISDALVRVGCVANKTRLLQFPIASQVPIHLHSHLLRGCVEGDGSFNLYDGGKENQLQLLGTKSFTEGAANTISSHTGVLCKAYPVDGSDWFYRLVKAGRPSVADILRWLYRDCDDMYLDRKYGLYRRICAIDELVPRKRRYDERGLHIPIDWDDVFRRMVAS